MASNEWTFTGTVRKFGETRPEGMSWGKMWISIEIPSIPGKVRENAVIINVPTAYGTDLDSKRTDRLKNGLKANAPIFIYGAKVDLLKRSRKTDSGWEDYYETGIRVYPKGITIGSVKFPDVNIGILAGKVTNVKPDLITISESYMVPRTKEKKTRPVPIGNINGEWDYVQEGSYVFAQLQIAGRNPKGEYQTMGFADKLVVL